MTGSLPIALSFGRAEHDLACLRQIGHDQRRRWLLRNRRRLGVKHGIREPPVEFVAAAVAPGRWGLRLAFGVISRAGKTNVKMVVVAPIGSYLGKPRTICAGLPTQRLFDRGVDEDALDVRGLCCGLDHREMPGGPDRRVDVAAILGDDIRCGHLFAFDPAQFSIRHRRQPNIGIKADLVARMSTDHRTAARLRHVTDQEAIPSAGLVHLDGKLLQETDQRRVPQLRLRDSRITCQAGPLIGNSVPPARHPLA